jgi:hypothetical protein
MLSRGVESVFFIGDASFSARMNRVWLEIIVRANEAGNLPALPAMVCPSTSMHSTTRTESRRLGSFSTNLFDGGPFSGDRADVLSIIRAIWNRACVSPLPDINGTSWYISYSLLQFYSPLSRRRLSKIFQPLSSRVRNNLSAIPLGVFDRNCELRVGVCFQTLRVHSSGCRMRCRASRPGTINNGL